jgi:TIR domain-containing protein
MQRERLCAALGDELADGELPRTVRRRMKRDPSGVTRPEVFICYASQDRDRVLPIAEELEAAGVRVWVDRNKIGGGSNYGQEIVRAIKGCKVLVVMCTEASMQSRNVRQEIQLAWNYEQSYLPLLLEPVRFPEQVQYWLEGCQPATASRWS